MTTESIIFPFAHKCNYTISKKKKKERNSVYISNFADLADKNTSASYFMLSGTAKKNPFLCLLAGPVVKLPKVYNSDLRLNSM